jgi:hypothetical protein
MFTADERFAFCSLSLIPFCSRVVRNTDASFSRLSSLAQAALPGPKQMLIPYISPDDVTPSGNSSCRVLNVAFWWWNTLTSGTKQLDPFRVERGMVRSTDNCRIRTARAKEAITRSFEVFVYLLLGFVAGVYLSSSFL